jgi:hypothetical protein
MKKRALICCVTIAVAGMTNFGALAMRPLPQDYFGIMAAGFCAMWTPTDCCVVYG